MSAPLSLEQRLYIYDTFLKTDDAKVVRKKFRKKFPGVDPPRIGIINILVKTFRKTGTVFYEEEGEGEEEDGDYDDEEEEDKPKKSHKKSNKSSKKKKGTKKIVSRLLKKQLDTLNDSDIEEIPRDDQEPIFQTVKVEMDPNEVSFKEEDYIPEEHLRIVKAEPSTESDDEMPVQSEKPVKVKSEPDSDVETNDVPKVSSHAIKVEPNSDDESSEDDRHFAKKLKLAKTKVKVKEEEEDDEM